MILKVKSEEVIFFMVSFGIINCHCEECFACAQRRLRDKQSDTKCHSEYFALAQYRLREESQTDCFTSFAMTNVKSIASWSLN